MILTLIHRIFVFLLLLLSLPVALCIALGITLTSGLPVLFQQKRVGQGGRVFTIYKFRTMRKGAQEAQKQFMHRNEADGPVFKIHDDPRFTGIGEFLAHTGLDELPQLINVLKGGMALIGPRPLPVSEAAKLKPWQKERQKIKPGIISPWILEGYHAQTFDAWMKSDIAYTKKKSIPYDLALGGRALAFLVKLLVHEIATHV